MNRALQSLPTTSMCALGLDFETWESTNLNRTVFETFEVRP